MDTDEGVLPPDVYLRGCASRTVLDVIANKWTNLVICALRDGRCASASASPARGHHPEDAHPNAAGARAQRVGDRDAVPDDSTAR